MGEAEMSSHPEFVEQFPADVARLQLQRVSLLVPVESVLAGYQLATLWTGHWFRMPVLDVTAQGLKG